MFVSFFFFFFIISLTCFPVNKNFISGSHVILQGMENILHLKYFTLKILYTYILWPHFSIKTLIYTEMRHWYYIPCVHSCLCFRNARQLLNPSTPISDDHLIYPNSITPE